MITVLVQEANNLISTIRKTNKFNLRAWIHKLWVVDDFLKDELDVLRRVLVAGDVIEDWVGDMGLVNHGGPSSITPAVEGHGTTVLVRVEYRSRVEDNEANVITVLDFFCQRDGRSSVKAMFVIHGTKGPATELLASVVYYDDDSLLVLEVTRLGDVDRH